MLNTLAMLFLALAVVWVVFVVLQTPKALQEDEEHRDEADPPEIGRSKRP